MNEAPRWNEWATRHPDVMSGSPAGWPSDSVGGKRGVDFPLRICFDPPTQFRFNRRFALPKLIRIAINMKTGSDGLDSTSKFNIILKKPYGATDADYTVAQTQLNTGDIREGDMTLYVNPDKAELSGYLIRTEIIQPRPNDHDHLDGSLSVYFYFDDGSNASFNYGEFAIGTFNESNSQERPIRFS